MSRVAKMPVKRPAGVQVSKVDGQLTVKGAKAGLTINVPAKVEIDVNGDVITVAGASIAADNMQAGTFRALLNNAVVGVSVGYEKKLQLRSEEHTSELQSLMRISYAVFCLKKKNQTKPVSTLCQITLTNTTDYLH